MKYCRNCGTLLEDTIEHCIRCGTDVTIAENVSMYPIEVMETIEKENQRKKASGKIVAMIIGLVVVLVALVFVFLYALGRNFAAPSVSDKKSTEAEAEAAPLAEETEEKAEVTPEAEPEEEPEATPVPSSGRAVKDDEGRYYDYVSEKDEAGNVIFTTLVPEDLTERQIFVDYEQYSDRYPIAFYYTASTKENDVRFTFFSPKKYWYKSSETGKVRSDEVDMTHYMTYLTYDGPKSFLEPLLKKDYPDAKIEMTNEYDISETVVTKLEELSKKKNKELFGDIGDYAHIGSNTTYANMDFDSSGKVYEYEITLKDKNMLFCRYYIPAMSFNLTYANKDTNDRGNITEWYNFSIVCFETGNEDNFDDFEEDFNMFIANSLPTDKFMYINEQYCDTIRKGIATEDSAIEASREVAAGNADEEEIEAATQTIGVEPLDKAMLEKFGNAYKPDTKLDDFDASVMDILKSGGPAGFKGDQVSVYGLEKAKVAFFDKEKNKVFVSPGEDEFPGDSYEELKKN